MSLAIAWLFSKEFALKSTDDEKYECHLIIVLACISPDPQDFLLQQ